MNARTKKRTYPWWLTHLHNACYAGMGIILLIHPAQGSIRHEIGLGSLLLIAGLCTGLFGLRRRQLGERDNYWFILSSLRDIAFGIALLVMVGNSLQTMINVLGLWAIVYAFLQAIEANFYFLGTRSNEDKDYGVEVIHFICVFIAGGFAFLSIMRPEGFPDSLRYVGLFLVGLGLAQAVLSWRLKNMITL